mmetsp:Transcript_15690/g.35704  ORF Transcript_15690/g.35704 Transcript_15690/m.35704 type:complete len:263 (-) Transcript_15690:444-1232(-)
MAWGFGTAGGGWLGSPISAPCGVPPPGSTWSVRATSGRQEAPPAQPPLGHWLALAGPELSWSPVAAMLLCSPTPRAPTFCDQLMPASADTRCLNAELQQPLRQSHERKLTAPWPALRRRLSQVSCPALAWAWAFRDPSPASAQHLDTASQTPRCQQAGLDDVPATEHVMWCACACHDNLQRKPGTCLGPGLALTRCGQPTDVGWSACRWAIGDRGTEQCARHGKHHEPHQPRTRYRPRFLCLCPHAGCCTPAPVEAQLARSC